MSFFRAAADRLPVPLAPSQTSAIVMFQSSRSTGPRRASSFTFSTSFYLSQRANSIFLTFTDFCARLHGFAKCRLVFYLPAATARQRPISTSRFAPSRRDGGLSRLDRPRAAGERFVLVHRGDLSRASGRSAARPASA